MTADEVNTAIFASLENDYRILVIAFIVIGIVLLAAH